MAPLSVNSAKRLRARMSAFAAQDAGKFLQSRESGAAAAGGGGQVFESRPIELASQARRNFLAFDSVHHGRLNVSDKLYLEEE
jgi:hypothetical protein